MPPPEEAAPPAAAAAGGAAAAAGGAAAAAARSRPWTRGRGWTASRSGAPSGRATRSTGARVARAAGLLATARRATALARGLDAAALARDAGGLGLLGAGGALAALERAALGGGPGGALGRGVRGRRRRRGLRGGRRLLGGALGLLRGRRRQAAGEQRDGEHHERDAGDRVDRDHHDRAAQRGAALGLGLGGVACEAPKAAAPRADGIGVPAPSGSGARAGESVEVVVPGGLLGRRGRGGVERVGAPRAGSGSGSGTAGAGVASGARRWPPRRPTGAAGAAGAALEVVGPADVVVPLVEVGLADADPARRVLDRDAAGRRRRRVRHGAARRRPPRPRWAARSAHGASRRCRSTAARCPRDGRCRATCARAASAASALPWPGPL